LAVLATAALWLAGCSVAAPHHHRPLPSTSPSPSARPPAPTLGLVATTTTASGNSSLDLISLSGTTLGSTALPSADGGAVAAGPGGGYYTVGYQLMRLGSTGAVTTEGTVALPPSGSGITGVPSSGFGTLAISPSGAQWAYVLNYTDPSTQISVAQIWIGGSNRAPRLLVNSQETPATLPAEFPGGFSYQLLGWVSRGVVVAEQPYGVGGAGPFLDYNVDSFFLNPTNAVQTPIENVPNCPLSGWTGSGIYACALAGSPGPDVSIQVGVPGSAVSSVALPADITAGSAVFNPAASQLVYSELNGNCSGCGGSIANEFASVQMELLNLAGGSSSALGPAGLMPAAWLPGGQIAALQYSADAAGSLSHALVLVDPHTGTLTTVSPDPTTEFVGVAPG